MESHECVTAESKVCKDCGVLKPLDCYYKQTTGTLFGHCKECAKLRDRANYLKNKERRLAQSAARRVAKSDELKQYRRQYYLENKERVLAQCKEYREREDVKSQSSQRAKLYYEARSADIQAKRKTAFLRDEDRQKRRAEYYKQHYEQNAHYYTEKTARRKRLQQAATPLWADLNAIRKIYLMAAKLSKAKGIQHHVDHIIPINGRNVCGLHVEANLQVLPAKVNLSKSNKFIEG